MGTLPNMGTSSTNWKTRRPISDHELLERGLRQLEQLDGPARDTSILTADVAELLRRAGRHAYIHVAELLRRAGRLEEAGRHAYIHRTCTCR